MSITEKTGVFRTEGLGRSGRGLWRRRIAVGGRFGMRRHGIMNDDAGAFGCFGDELEMRFEGGILAMLEEQAIGVASNNGNDIIQFVRDCGRYMLRRIGFRGHFERRAHIGGRLGHFFIDVFHGGHRDEKSNLHARFALPAEGRFLGPGANRGIRSIRALVE